MRFKFVLAYLLLSFITMALIAVILLQQIGESMFTRAESDMDARAVVFTSAIMSALERRDSALLSEEVETAASALDARVLAYDINGVIQADSLKQSNGIVFNADRGVYRSESVLAFSNTDSILTGLYTYQSNMGGVLVSVSLDEEYTVCVSALKTILPVMLALYMLCSILMLAAVRVFTIPFGELNEGIRRMSAGDFTTRVNTNGMDREFTALANAFNDMMNRVETLDRSRNSFVSNASHELKTPLATMKIMIESVLYQEAPDEEMTKEFLGDANKEIDRLSNIITDLLTLVGMDSGEKSLKITRFDLVAHLNDIIRRLSPLARQRGLDLTFTGPERLDISADPEKLTEVFINLVDNALKYTPRPGSVFVELTRTSGKAIVKVTDTGIGISEKDQAHIFDRFYRVDKARSRETGGTGLGLSIVKQIILQHNGTISLTSVPEKGSTFTVKLPLTPEKSK